MRKVKSAVSLLIVFSVLLTLIGCGNGKIRCSYAELAFDLPKSFEPYTEAEDSFDAAFYDGETVMGMLRISFVAGYDNGIPDTLSPEKFAKYYMNKIERTGDIDVRGDVPYFIYYNTEGGVTYFYLAAFYRTRYAYFVVSFITEAKNEYKNTEKYLEYASGAYILDVEQIGG